MVCCGLLWTPVDLINMDRTAKGTDKVIFGFGFGFFFIFC